MPESKTTRGRPAKKQSAAFDKISAGLREALAYTQGEAVAVRLHLPEAVDVKAVREATGLSQAAFAATFGFTVHQIRQWEQKRVSPSGALRAYLLLIRSDPAGVREKLHASLAA